MGDGGIEGGGLNATPEGRGGRRACGLPGAVACMALDEQLVGPGALCAFILGHGSQDE